MHTPTAPFRFLHPVLVTLMLRHPSGCQDDVMLLQGDVMLGALFPVNNVQNNECGDFDAHLLKGVTVVTWFLDKINAMDYVPGITIGLHAYRTCQNSEKAARAVIEMMETYKIVGKGSSWNSTTPLLGLLGPGTTSEAVVVARMLGSMPENKRLLQVSASATGEALADRVIYPNFFRVIPPDSTQVQVLAELLAQLKWNYVAIVYDEDAYGHQAAYRLRDLAQDRGICVPCFASLPLDYKSIRFRTASDAIRSHIDGKAGSPIKGIVFIGRAVTAKNFVRRLSSSVSYVRFVFSEALGLQAGALTDGGQVSILGRGALAASPPHLPLPEFRDYWLQIWENRTAFLAETSRNPWLEKFYEQATNCATADDLCWETNRGSESLVGDGWLFEYYAAKAVAIFAAVLKDLHKSSCAAPGLCLELKHKLIHDRPQIQNILQSKVFNIENDFSNITSAFSGQTSVGFDERWEVTDYGDKESLYDVYNFRLCQDSEFCFQKVGSYTTDHKLELNTALIRGYTDEGKPLTWPEFSRSQCLDGYDCLECLPRDIPGQVVLIPGDFYFVAVAPVHDRTQEGALHCGDIRTVSAADLVENVIFAVDQVNAKDRSPFHGIFGNKTLGVIILDSCYRELVIKERLINLYKGQLLLPDGRKSSDILPYITGVVGDYYSTTSVAIYEVLSMLGTRFVHVGPSNTSPLFSNKKAYPYFLRLITKYEEFNRALFSLLQELQFHYVQVIYDPSDVYTSTVKAGMDIVSPQYNVCIAQSIPTRYEDANMNPILDQMRRASSASVVIVILVSQHVHKVMTQILPRMLPTDNFVFIGGTAWANIETVFQAPNKDRLLGSLTFIQQLPVDGRFDDYFHKVDPLTSRNPWLKYFWEKRNHCYFDGSFQRKGKSGLCPKDLTSDYKQDPWTPFFINSVYAFALGLDAAMKEHCRPQGNVLCDALTSERLRDALKTVKLDLHNTGQPVEVFDSNGDGDIGYMMFQISHGNNADTLVYEKVGRYEHGQLTLDNKQELLVVKNGHRAPCPDPDTCSKCFSPPLSARNCGMGDSSPSDRFVTSVLVPCIVIITILLVVIVVIVVLSVKRQLPVKESANQDWRMLFSVSAHRSEQARRCVSQPEAVERTEELPLPTSNSTPTMFCRSGLQLNAPSANYTSEDQAGSPYDVLDLPPRSVSPALAWHMQAGGCPGNTCQEGARLTLPDTSPRFCRPHHRGEVPSAEVADRAPSTGSSPRVSSPLSAVPSLGSSDAFPSPSASVKVPSPSSSFGLPSPNTSVKVVCITDADGTSHSMPPASCRFLPLDPLHRVFPDVTLQGQVSSDGDDITADDSFSLSSEAAIGTDSSVPHSITFMNGRTGSSSPESCWSRSDGYLTPTYCSDQSSFQTA